MFDLRYHVASLAAVFLALIIGILVGVGISGPVDNAETGFLERRVADLQQRLDQTAQQSTALDRERKAARTFINETYPVLVRNRLRGEQIVVLFVGSAAGASRSAVDRALAEARAKQLRLRAVKVPIDPRQLDAALAGEAAATGLRGRRNLESLGRALGQELMSGGETPLWNALTDAVVEERAGGSSAPADGVVVVRTVKPQRDGTSRFLLGLYSGIASAGVPAVGVETTDAAHSGTGAFRDSGLSTVDDVDTPIGRLALVLLLDGATAGHYGLKDSAGDGALPPFPAPAAAGG